MASMSVSETVSSGGRRKKQLYKDHHPSHSLSPNHQQQPASKHPAASTASRFPPQSLNRRNIPILIKNPPSRCSSRPPPSQSSRPSSPWPNAPLLPAPRPTLRARSSSSARTCAAPPALRTAALPPLPPSTTARRSPTS